MDKVDDMSRSPERQRAMRKLHHLLGLLELLPEVIVTCGIAVSWYIRYSYYQYTSLLVVGACGLAVALFNLLLCYLNRPAALPSLYHLWLGCLLGLVGLLDISSNLQHALGEWEEVANLMLVASVICQGFVVVLMRCCRAQSVLDRLWSRMDLLELIGAAGACLLAAPPDDLWSLLLLILALGVVLTALRVGSVLSVGNLALLLFTCQHYLFPDLHLSINPYGMIVLIARLAISPLLDLALGGWTRLDRWRGLIIARPFCHRLTLGLMLLVEGCFFVAHASVVKQHKEWYVVVPLFAVASIVWLIMHIIFAVILFTLASRFSASQISTIGSLSLKKALAARGLRYFALVAQRLMCACMLTTGILGLLCWTTRTIYNFSLLSIVLALEAMVAELLSEFSRSLGGTCVGSGIVAPVVTLRNDGSVTVLPPNFIQEAGARSTRTLRAIVEFFSEHMITNCGCDWNMAGVSVDDVEKKLANFFQQTTPEGPRYDTYFFYYSGPTTPTGDWALTNGGTLSLDRLLSIWGENNPDRGASRLVLMCDCEHASQWAGLIRRLAGSETFVALQTLQLSKSRRDPETPPAIGDFTEAWTDFNSSLAGGLRSAVFESQKPLYSVSRRWTDYDFRHPSAEEVLEYWTLTLPRLTHCCLKMLMFGLSTRSPFCELCCSRVVRRVRLRLWPPAELDTGHGFRLLLG